LVTNIGKIGLFNLLVDCFRIVTGHHHYAVLERLDQKKPYYIVYEAGWQQVAAEKRFLTGSSDNGL